MTEDSNKPKSTLTLSSTKNVDQIKQAIARGGSRSVIVEVKKNRSITKEEKNTNQKNNQNSRFNNQSSLTDDEKNARLEALKIAAKQAQILKEQEEARLESIRIQEEEERRIAKDQQKLQENNIPNNEYTETEQNKETNIIETSRESDKKDRKSSIFNNIKETDDSNKDEHDEKSSKKSVKTDSKNHPKTKWEENRRNSGKISINSAFELEEKTRSLASIKRARAKAKRLENNQYDNREKIVREIILPEVITVQEFASRMAERSADVIKELMKMGIIATASQNIDADTAEIIADILGHKVKRITESDIENILIEQDDKSEELEQRAPVVTIMGHVDHGKTSLLDALRSTDVAAGEAGGITQHIGAYQVTLENGSNITFLDTPGHEAFTAMRSRGAKSTDIVVLVVAADDGIMAQTIEAINHAKAANVPIIVAINKIDKIDANPDKVREELLIHGLVAEEFGGDIMTVPVSAKSRLNLDKLEECILLQAEILDLKANSNRTASGVVIESKVDKNRGVVATLLIQKGKLKLGDIVVAGASYGKIKAIINDKSIIINNATPSMPVEILGLSTPPIAGDSFGVVDTEKQAREISEFRSNKARNLRTNVKRIGLDDLFSKSSSNNKELALIIKADVQGSIEAIAGSLSKFNNDEVSVKIIHQAVGGITESDISLSQASKALIVGFNVRATSNAKDLANKENIELRYYSIIYNLIDDVKAILNGMLSPIFREEYLGSVSIRQIFNITKIGKVAGSIVTQGMVKRGSKVRLLRDNIVIHEGKLKTLRRFKDDVKEVKEGFECGIAFENYDDIREKDVVEVFEIIEEKQEL